MPHTFKYNASFQGGMKTLTAILHKEEDQYVAKCPEIGTVSQGPTIEEAISNLKEATELYLEEFPDKESSKIIIATFEVTGHAKT
jgi:predicted RNase H-like HicB family nuclease